jgi:AcrR family transcriptional regulator
MTTRSRPARGRPRATAPAPVHRGKARAQHARNTMYRQLIVEAAEELFADGGTDDTRMEAIAAGAGLSLGTLYSVFAGKAEVVRAIHDTRLREVLQLAVDSVRELRAPLDMLLAGVRTYLQFFLAHPHYLRMHLREGYSWAMAGATLATREQAEAWRDGVQMQAALFERGSAEGTFYPGDALVMTRMMIAMQQIQLASWVERGMTDDTDTLIADIEAQIRRSFCPPNAHA